MGIRPLYFSLSLLLVGAISGCGKSSSPAPMGPPAHPVQGKVVYQGRPAAKFRVAMYPTTPWEGAQFAPAGVTDSEGRFSIGSYKDDDGAPVGDYTVTFTWPKHLITEGDGSEEPEVDQLAGRYADPKTSPFHVTVKEGQNESPPFDLK